MIQSTKQLKLPQWYVELKEPIENKMSKFTLKSYAIYLAKRGISETEIEGITKRVFPNRND